jgi:hypothetical protein
MRIGYFSNRLIYKAPESLWLCVHEALASRHLSTELCVRESLKE